jgi:hypothetical protein
MDLSAGSSGRAEVLLAKDVVLTEELEWASLMVVLIAKP